MYIYTLHIVIHAVKKYTHYVLWLYAIKKYNCIMWYILIEKACGENLLRQGSQGSYLRKDYIWIGSRKSKKKPGYRKSVSERGNSICEGERAQCVHVTKGEGSNGWGIDLQSLSCTSKHYWKYFQNLITFFFKSEILLLWWNTHKTHLPP